MAKADLTAERLRELLHYDPETGVFTWKIRTSNRVKVGSIAGVIDPNGYIRIRLDGRLHQAHRLAWLYMAGQWPAIHIDHINGEKAYNRWCNLREATHAQNMQNKCRYASNTSGYAGISWHNECNKWRARIRVDGKRKHLGLFDTPEEAYVAYVEAKRHLHEFNTL